jgi:DNA invertase Pin-like site-specific DNA recombinase
MGELVLLILAWCAKMESQILSQRVKAGIERYKQKKGHWGRPRVKVTSEEVRALREMGFSYRAIAKQLGVSVGKVLELVRSQKGGVMNGRRNGVG